MEQREKQEKTRRAANFGRAAAFVASATLVGLLGLAGCGQTSGLHASSSQGSAASGASPSAASAAASGSASASPSATSPDPKLASEQAAEQDAEQEASQEAQEQRSKAAADFAERLQALREEADLASGAARTTRDMNAHGAEYEPRFEALMKEVYAYVEALPDADADELEQEQADWQAEFDGIPDRVLAEYGRGTLVASAIYSEQMAACASRTEELIALIDPSAASPSDASSADGDSTQNSEVEAEANDEEQTPSQSAESEPAPTSSPASKASDEASLDLEASDDSAMVNERLSWMADVFYHEGGAVDLSDPENLVWFGIDYLGVTDLANWESPDDIEKANRGLNTCVDALLVLDVVEDYFGKTLSKDDLEGVYDFDGSYFYFNVTAPPGQIASYSAANEAESLGDGRYRIVCELFYDDKPFAQHDASFFSLDSDGMAAELGKVTSMRPGEAVVHVAGSDTDKRIVFEEYTVGELEDPSAGAEEPDAADPEAEPAEPESEADGATATYWGTGAIVSEEESISSITFADGKVTIDGPLRERDGSSTITPAIEGPWVFDVDENTVYGYGNDTGFHEQPLSELEESWSEGRFPTINVEVVDGVVARMYMTS